MLEKSGISDTRQEFAFRLLNLYFLKGPQIYQKFIKKERDDLVQRLFFNKFSESIDF